MISFSERIQVFVQKQLKHFGKSNPKGIQSKVSVRSMIKEKL